MITCKEEGNSPSPSPSFTFILDSYVEMLFIMFKLYFLQHKIAPLIIHSLPSFSPYPFQWVGAICLLLSCLCVVPELKRIHEDLGVVFGTIWQFLSMFYGISIVFLILWFSWSVSNYLIMGSTHSDFRDFGNALFLTFR